MADARWPLSAAATRLLLDLPSPGGRPRSIDPDPDALKLALKELVARGAMTMAVKRRSGGDRVILAPGEEPDALPTPLWRLDQAVRPQLPGEVGQVMKKARYRNPYLIQEVMDGVRNELSEHGLIEQHSFRRLGLFPARGWTRTASGDAWTATARERLDRSPDAGPAMEPAAGERPRRRDAGDPTPVYYLPDTTLAPGGGPGFDVLGGIGDLIDQGGDWVGGALDSAMDTAGFGDSGGSDSGGGGDSGGSDSGGGGDSGGGDSGGGGGGD